MKYFELDKKENEILQGFEKGDFNSVKDYKKEASKYKNYAKITLNKTKNVNLRLSEKDLQKIKTMASEEGIPYQTLLSSLIHRYIGGKLKNS